MTEELTENDVRDVFLWAVEVVSAWGGGSPRLDKAEASLDRFFGSLRAEGWSEGVVVGRNLVYIERYDQYDRGSLGFREVPPNPFRAEETNRD